MSEEAITPTLAHKDDAGLDLYAVSKKIEATYVEYDTGIALEIPKGYVGLLFPRSSITKTDQILGNSVGIIDSNFRQSIRFRFKLDTGGYEKILRNKIETLNLYKVGDRIGQIVIIKKNKIELTEVDELSKTDRDGGMFGSSGK